MKRYLPVIIAFLLVGFGDTFGQSLRAEFAMARFESPNDGPYVETYLKLIGPSLKPIEVETGSYSEVFITIHISKGVWVPFKDAYKVRGPIIPKGETPLDFIDQRRIPLKPGTYDLEMTIKDLRDSSATAAKINQVLVIEKARGFNVDSLATETMVNSVAQSTDESYVIESSGNSEKPVSYRSPFFMSSIQLVDSYTTSEKPNILTKSGYDLIPYTSDYYPESKSDISFYAEVYGLSKSEKPSEKDFLIDMFIENADNGKLVEGLRKFVKREYAEVVPVLQSFPIQRLETGNYNVVIEIRDRENKLMDRRIMFFQRFNGAIAANEALETIGKENELYGTFVTKYQDLDMLKEYLRCLHPISSQQEITQVNTRMNFRDRNMMWKFMFNFWNLRDPNNPEQAWLNYWKEVQKVNANYTTNLRKGYDTDRGRVYLQYGAPNTISPNYFEPNTYPYEIWHYYELRDNKSAAQSNRKFVFANTEQGSPEFILIHSDAKNEITNIRWNYDLHKRSSATVDLDQENTGDHYGGRSKDFFENPY
jgi:GWxTD domain-containing protein